MVYCLFLKENESIQCTKNFNASKMRESSVLNKLVLRSFVQIKMYQIGFLTHLMLWGFQVWRIYLSIWWHIKGTKKNTRGIRMNCNEFIMLNLIIQPLDMKKAMFLVLLGNCKSQELMIYMMWVQSSPLKVS
jgi:hypothetical protein